MKFPQPLLLLILIFLMACGGQTEPATSDLDPEPEAAAETEAEAEDEPTATAVPEEPTATPVEEPTLAASDEPADDHHADDEDEDHAHGDDTHTHTDGVDLSLFFDGALAEDVTVVNCTLSDGTETMCYEITVAGEPANHEIGPFCPETTTTDAADAGIWFDGNAVYDVDGDFVLGLADLYNDSNWKLYNDDGSVNITETAEEFDLAARPNVDPSVQNHCVAGKMEWLENGEAVPTTVTIPMEPIPADTPSTASGNWGITLNGVVIAAAAPVDAILGAYTIAVFDDCGGHINPIDGYHLHGARGCSEVGESSDGETPIFGYALDGYPIHSPLSEEAAAEADLDECNGHYTEALGYHYHANPAEENGVLTCFKGLTIEGVTGGAGGPGGGGPGGGRGGG